MGDDEEMFGWLRAGLVESGVELDAVEESVELHVVVVAFALGQWLRRGRRCR